MDEAKSAFDVSVDLGLGFFDTAGTTLRFKNVICDSHFTVVFILNISFFCLRGLRNKTSKKYPLFLSFFLFSYKVPCSLLQKSLVEKTQKVFLEGTFLPGERGGSKANTKFTFFPSKTDTSREEAKRIKAKLLWPQSLLLFHGDLDGTAWYQH